MIIKDLVNGPMWGPIIGALVILGGSIVLGFIFDLFINADESSLYKWFSRLHEFSKKVLKRLRL